MEIGSIINNVVKYSKPQSLVTVPVILLLDGIHHCAVKIKRYTHCTSGTGREVGMGLLAA